ncbi:four helix bundle sensory module for signal transduction domain-containing protein [Rhizoctonia solani AG-1 IA]|uniref:Four helix bundle sensory module for signal transduction domain-containing protein n=1 Tax=Thanatephorus cucumeris (strain AG1-IA) TaxID=983506 RepID=L8X854_THACA|nr:four helix bundle sensory module for signal transduction domain-containing protein [Rhizoctonia solani AG-1 IA]
MNPQPQLIATPLQNPSELMGPKCSRSINEITMSISLTLLEHFGPMSSVGLCRAICHRGADPAILGADVWTSCRFSVLLGLTVSSYDHQILGAPTSLSIFSYIAADARVESMYTDRLLPLTVASNISLKIEANPLTSLSATGSVASRFVTQSEIDSAKERREEQWKAAYARLGQEPPPRPTEDPEYDGRSLYELISLIDEKVVKEQKRKDEENEELKNFREAVSQREAQQAAANPVPPPSSSSKPAPKLTVSTPAKSQPKKNQKAILKGAIVRKPGASTSGSAKSSTKPPTPVKPSFEVSTPAPQPAALDNKPSSKPLDETLLGKKRSESSILQDVGEAETEGQSTKRQKI